MANWSDILKDVITKVIMMAIVGILGWIKGKKYSSKAIERKNEVYQPLLDELSKYTTFEWSFLDEIEVSFFNSIVLDYYKYGLKEDLKTKCSTLFENIQEYNMIKPVFIAKHIITDIFIEGYECIYGSTIDGVSTYEDRYGDKIDDNIIAESVQIMQTMDCSNEIKTLLLNEGWYSGEVCIDYNNRLYKEIYVELKRIYGYALNAIVNGEPIKHPKPIIELDMLPEEYMACYYDFFERYNQDERIQRRRELKEEITYASQAIVEELKEIIEKIVKLYEVEEI